MKICPISMTAAIVLSIASQCALAGDAEITLKANVSPPPSIKYGPVITIKPKGLTESSRVVTADPSTNAAYRPAPAAKIEPEEIDSK
ncbi:hypothetical protein PH586_05670 [Pseudomonas sp. SA3-5]|uniref:Uncharacterized protein n=1 Tax=Pseudomonas aestuarii TaxID=3018340 RepID=A0ABT4XCD7_9PSED|nr:hypothetical protein [Pseudomonas aestuarii]MDA7085876.1 hypothetical protein [Pseudomonas aestuarii]